MSFLEVHGAQQLGRLASALHEAGRTDLQRELGRGLRKAGQAVADNVRAHTDDYMPAGYERTFAGALKLKVQVRMTNESRVSIVPSAMGKKGHPRQIAEMEAGRLKKPVFGRVRRLKDGTLKRRPWEWQRIRPHWLTEPATAAAPAARHELEQAMHRVADKIAKAV